MKKTLYILFAAAVAALMLSCAKNEPFAAVTEDDTPRILNTNIPEWSDGAPGILASVAAGEKFNFKILVTPVEYTTVVWNMDGTDIFEGTEIDMELPAGTHQFKVTATTTKGKSTSRSFQVVVRAGETIIWEGSFNVTWGTPFNELQTTLRSKVDVGVVLRAYVNGNGQGSLATAWWRNLATGYSDDDLGRGDTPIDGDAVLEVTISELSLSLLDEQDGFLIVGDGYTVTKVTIE